MHELPISGDSYTRERSQKIRGLKKTTFIRLVTYCVKVDEIKITNNELTNLSDKLQTFRKFCEGSPLKSSKR